MDGRDFETLTKRVAAAGSRRGMMQALAAGLAAAALGTARGEQAAAADVGAEFLGFCTLARFPCTRKTRCCSGKCRAGRCTCLKKGKTCFQGFGANCCSRKCQNGKCK